jgi:hypothetical protein
VGNRGLPPERVRLVLDLLASGLNPNRAAAAAAVSIAFAYGLHHKMGGVYRPAGVTYSARYPLQLAPRSSGDPSSGMTSFSMRRDHSD